MVYISNCYFIWEASLARTSIVVIHFWRVQQEGVVSVKDGVASFNCWKILIYAWQRIDEYGTSKPLVVGRIGERASCQNLSIADIAIDCRIMIVDWCLNLGNHELGDRRSGARDNAGDLDGVILSQIQEEIPVVSICSVEFIPVKIHA